MPVWQIILEFIKTVGAGSLLGVVIGLGATRQQKKREALQLIKSANYREVVEKYRELLAHLLKIKEAAIVVQAVAQILARHTDETNPYSSKSAKSRVTEALQAYDESREGLEESVAALIVHRSETDFHAHAKSIISEGIEVGLEFRFFRDMWPNEEGYERLSGRVDGLRSSIDNLGLLWDEWKIEAERDAAGLRPRPQLASTLSRIHVGRRL